MYTSLRIETCVILLAVFIPDVLSSRLPLRADYTSLILPANGTNPLSPSDRNTVLPDPDAGNGDIVWPDTSTSLNDSSSFLNTSSQPLGSPQYHCNGKAYGKNLNLASCTQALHLMPDTKKPLTFGQRGKGDWDANLPFRILSRNGLCAIDIAHRAGAVSDTITPVALRQNAAALIDLCVGTKPNEGGVVSNLGKHGNLALRVTPYRPRVTCQAQGPLASDCKAIIDVLPVDGQKQVFGRKGNPDPEITLRIPISYLSWRRECQVYIDTLPETDIERYDWYKICAWEFRTPYFSWRVRG